VAYALSDEMKIIDLG